MTTRFLSHWCLQYEPLVGYIAEGGRVGPRFVRARGPFGASELMMILWAGPRAGCVHAIKLAIKMTSVFFYERARVVVQSNL